MPGADVLPQGGNESRDGIVAAPFQGPENGHQNPLGQRALVAAVAVHDLADQHREADLALPVVVGRGNLRMAQKREELVPVFLQPRGQAARVGVRVASQRQIQQTPVQPLDARRIAFRGEIGPRPQPQGVLDQPLGFPRERLPLRGEVALMHLDQLVEQVEQATLMQGPEDGVVGRPEIGDQDAFERLVEDPLQGRAAAAAVHEIDGDRFGGEAP